MNVSELTAGKPIPELTVDIFEAGESRQNRAGIVQNLKARDETGEVEVVLWNDEIGKYSIGDKIKITKGWCNQYQSTLQASSGKFGKIEKIGETKTQTPKAAGQSTTRTVLENHLRPTISEIRGRHKQERQQEASNPEKQEV